MHHDRLRQSARKAMRGVVDILPIVAGMLLLTSLMVKLFPRTLTASLFGVNEWFDLLLGASVGSIAAGHPLISYILSGELIARGVSLLAVTALMVSWVTVGVVQLPAEALILGRQFAVSRNLLCLLSAIAVAILTVGTLSLLGPP